MLKNILTLGFAKDWRTYAGIATFAVSCGLEWVGIDVPGFVPPSPVESLTLILVALGIYERVKLANPTPSA